MPEASYAAGGTPLGVADAGNVNHDSASVTVGANQGWFIWVTNSDGSPVDPSGLQWVPGAQSCGAPIHQSGTIFSFVKANLYFVTGLTPGTGVFRGTWPSNQGERMITPIGYIDYNTTTPYVVPPDPASGSSTAFSVTQNPTTQPQRVVAFGLHFSTAFSNPQFNSPNGTERGEAQMGPTDKYHTHAVQDIAAAGATQALTWTLSETPDGWYGVAVAINGATASNVDLEGSAQARATLEAHLAGPVALGGGAQAAARVQGRLEPAPGDLFILGDQEDGSVLGGENVLGGYLTAAAPVVDLAGNAAAQANVAGALNVSVSLAGASIGLSTGTGTVSHVVPMVGLAAGQAAVEAALTHGVPLTAIAQAVASVTGGLSVSVPLAGVSGAIAAVTGDLSVTSGVALGGSAQAQSTVAGGLQLVVNFAGSVLAQALVQGALTVSNPSALQGSAAALSNVAGELALVKLLAGSALGQALVAAALSVSNPSAFEGNAAASSAVAGALSLAKQLDGSSLGQALVSGALSVAGPNALEGEARAATGVIGSLSMTLNLAASAAGASLGGGSMTVGIPLSGQALAQALVGGGLQVSVSLAGAAVARTIVIGELLNTTIFTVTPSYVVRRNPRDWTVKRDAANARNRRVSA